MPTTPSSDTRLTGRDDRPTRVGLSGASYADSYVGSGSVVSVLGTEGRAVDPDREVFRVVWARMVVERIGERVDAERGEWEGGGGRGKL